MHSSVILNDKLVEAERARLPAISQGALYGRGVFTTLAIHRARPFLWNEHWARLTSHADRAGVDRSRVDEEETRAALMKLIEANALLEGRARITLFSNAGAEGLWKLDDAGEDEGQTVELLIMTADAHEPSADSLALTVSPYRVNQLSPLAGIKTVNYLEHIIARDEARARDFHEAVMLNERCDVVSATMANIFWVKEGALHTPALSTGALAGTTRACVLALAEDLGIPVVEGVNELAQLADADEIFLTSAGLGLGIVTTFDFHHYTVPIGSVALRLHEAFRQLTLSSE